MATEPTELDDDFVADAYPDGDMDVMDMTLPLPDGVCRECGGKGWVDGERSRGMVEQLVCTECGDEPEVTPRPAATVHKSADISRAAQEGADSDPGLQQDRFTLESGEVVCFTAYLADRARWCASEVDNTDGRGGWGATRAEAIEELKQLKEAGIL